MNHRASAAQRAYSRISLVSLVLAIVGVGLAIWGFVSGIDAALDGSGNGPETSIVVFYVGSALLIVSVVLAITGLVRSFEKVIPTAALVVSTLPVAVIIVIALASRH